MKNTETMSAEGAEVASNAKSLLDSTSHMAEKGVSEARKRLAQTWEQVQSRTREGARVTDEAIRERPYYALGIAFGVGALIGFLLTRRNR